MKIFGFVPARMAASRFPGKPLAMIKGRPMVEHCFERAKLYSDWSSLHLATCDDAIANFGMEKGYSVIMTSDRHTRCLDRIAEAGKKCGQSIAANDIVVCVQGDEPMLHPEMIAACIAPLEADPAKAGTILAMHIIEHDQFINPDTVKIIHNSAGRVLYTSRAPVPYVKGGFGPDVMARRIYGIFAFRWQYLLAFTEMSETRLERLEACDSNRILDSNFCQYIAPYPYRQSFSVDSPGDLQLVEASMEQDAWWGKY